MQFGTAAREGFFAMTSTGLTTRRAVMAGAGATGLTACARPTPQFTVPGDGTLPGSIAEESWLEMDRARTWLLVRGRSTAAPAVLFLHGGPGGSETALMRLFNPALENAFVMAYWDQRGAGRSYD